METGNLTALNIFVTSAGSELGIETVKQLVKRGHRVVGQIQESKERAALLKVGATVATASSTNEFELTQALQTAQPEVLLNLTPQIPNTLLHDGQDWKGYDEFLPAATLALLKAARKAEIKFLVHASYAFLYGNKHNATEDTALTVPGNDPIFAAAVEAEKMVVASTIPLCLLRLGFLYGPASHDLELYEKSFRIFRPYFSGPAYNLSNFLHHEDAALALALVVEQQPGGQIFNLVDGNPASFGDFIDYFAQSLGKPKPPHIPTWGALLARLIIQQSQMELLDLSTTVDSSKARSQLGWTPQYTTYRQGLTQIAQIWQRYKMAV